MPPAADGGDGARFEVRRFDAPLGAEILGLDLSRPVDEATFGRINRAFLDHHVLVFRDQRLTPEQHIAFSRRFGPLQIHVLDQFLLPGHPEILVVSNVVEGGRAIGLADAGRYWHSDLSYLPVPSLGSLLHARELPAVGGDTLFADLTRAYERLDDGIRRLLDGLKAEHDYQRRYEALRRETGVRPPLTEAQQAQVRRVAVHPVVRTHPETGRKALYVNEGFTSRILFIGEDDSAELLAYLFALSTADDNVFRHRWQADDLVLWDNRCVIHAATPLPPGQRRTLYRTTVEGDVPA